MRLFRSLIPVAFALPFLSIACGDEGEEPFDTFDDCYVDHHEEEAFDRITSIKICCIDHPIGGQDPDIVCGETAQDCVDFVDAEVLDAELTLPEIEQACDEYLVERNQ
jgi:hypothetical protein